MPTFSIKLPGTFLTVWTSKRNHPSSNGRICTLWCPLSSFGVHSIFDSYPIGSTLSPCEYKQLQVMQLGLWPVRLWLNQLALLKRVRWITWHQRWVLKLFKITYGTSNISDITLTWYHNLVTSPNSQTSDDTLCQISVWTVWPEKKQTSLQCRSAAQLHWVFFSSPAKRCRSAACWVV